MHPLFNPKAYFHFLNINFTLSTFYEFLRRTDTLSTFSLCIMLGMHFDNVSVLLNSVAATYVHLATLSVTITCWYVHIGALLNFIWGLLFEKTYLIVIKDETGLKSKLNASTLILIGSYVRKLVASYLKKGR